MSRLLLLGGGHTHLAAIPLLRRLQPDRPIALLAPSPRLLYSGMMPGWIAGQYGFDDCRIDVRGFCRRWRVEWIEAEAADVDVTEAKAKKAPAEARTSTELIEALQGTSADAPLCVTCGTKMRPAGSCYVCEGCGSTSGCS